MTRADPGTRATAQAEARAAKQLREIYEQARKELTAKMEDFQRRFAAKDAQKQQEYAEGKITKAAYDEWRRRQLFNSKIWQQKVEQATKTLLDANRQAVRVINGEKMDVFAENANYQAYQMSKDAQMGLNFTLYDKDTVGRLMREEPELIPRKVVDGKRDVAWNQKKIANSINQGIIQGESLPQITQRLSKDLAMENNSAMARYAATAMTAAQNAGRIETMHRAQEMGIKVKKKWLATLDNRTRDSHAELDGQVVDVDEPFVTHNRDGSLAEIMFPGDPQADGEQVWNCRCDMIYVYEEYPDAEDAERIAAEEYTDDDGKLRTRPTYVKGMTYKEWKRAQKEQKKSEDMPQRETESELERKINRANEEITIPKAVIESVTKESASEDWFEYEYAKLMGEYIRTGRMPTKDMNQQSVSMETRQKLAAEAKLIQETGEKTKTEYKMLYRGMVLPEDQVREMFTPREVYTFDTLTAATPDKKIAGIYTDVENAGGEGVPVIIEIEKPDGIYGFKRDDLETVLPKGSEFRVERNWMDENGIVHISLYAKKGKKNIKEED